MKKPKKLVLRRETERQPRPLSLNEQALEKVAGGTTVDAVGDPDWPVSPG